MKNSMPKIAVVIINFNGEVDTIACLKSLNEVTINNFTLDIIVVDNNSTDSSRAAIKAAVKEISENRKVKKLINFSVILNSENLGFCEGNNIGIKQALRNKSDYIFLLNNDTIADKETIRILLKTARKYKKVGIIGPKIYFAPGFEYHREAYNKNENGKVIWYSGGEIDWNNLIFSHLGVDNVDKGQFDKTIETDFISGCAMFIKKDVFNSIGFFDKRYFLYLEDVDLCERARRAGFELFYEPKALVWHKNASATGKPGSKIHIYYLTRNRLIFGYSYSSWRTKIAIFRESLRMLFGNNPIQKKAIWDFFTGNFERADNLI